MKYLILGAGGMAGHLIASYMQEQGEQVVGLARRKLSFCETLVADATDFKGIDSLLRKYCPDVIVNCIGILNRSADEQIGNAILINAYLPHFLADRAERLNAKVIQMSTDCVFSGRTGKYIETDIPDGASIYDRTKALGELNDNRNLTFRNSIVGPDINEKGIGLFHWFMKQTGAIDGYEGSVWNGVTTLTLAKAIYAVGKGKLAGIYHLVNNIPITKYALLELFKRHTFKELEIHKVSGVVQNKTLINTRKDFQFEVPSYNVQVYEMIQWIKAHPNLYCKTYPELCIMGGDKEN